MAYSVPQTIAGTDTVKTALLTKCVANFTDIYSKLPEDTDELTEGSTNKYLLAGAVTNTEVSASAAIAFSKLAALTSANILVGNGSNVVASVSMSGDITISNAGVTTIGSSKVTTSKINSNAVSYAKLNSDVTSNLKKLVLFDDPQVHTSYLSQGTSPWTDLDFTTSTSSKATAIILEVYISDTATSRISFRKNGETTGTETFFVRNQVNSETATRRFVIPCDTGQIIERDISASSATIKIYVAGYYEDFDDLS